MIKETDPKLETYSRRTQIAMGVLSALQFLAVLLVVFMPKVGQEAQITNYTIIGAMVYLILMLFLIWGLTKKSRIAYAGTVLLMVPALFLGGLVGILFAIFILYNLFRARKLFFV